MDEVERIFCHTESRLDGTCVRNRECRCRRRGERTDIEVPRENVSGERRLHLRIAQRELGLTLHGFGSIYRCERRIKTGLRKVIIWLRQTLCGIECFGPAEVLFRLRVLCNRRVDLRTGFIRLIRQVLTTYFGQYRSLRVV